MMKRIILFTFVSLLVSNVAEANCQGCCSHHDGVVCDKGKTKCGDGSPLSSKCRAKGCNECGDYQEEPKPRPRLNSRPDPSPLDTGYINTSPYSRADWPHWIDEDKDCQDTRAEILIRDNVGTLKYKRNKPCNVSWGRWICPYTGKEILKASDADIDHIVPLAHAHRTGGENWTREKKRAFANDPLNLVAVDAATNVAKGDKGPDEWKPPRKEFWPEYARRWQAIKVKYGLSISAGEEEVLREMEKTK